MTDAVETPSVLLLFTGRSSAFIVPARDLAAAGQADAVQALLRERLGDRARLLSGNQTRGDPTLGEVADLPGGVEPDSKARSSRWFSLNRHIRRRSTSVDSGNRFRRPAS